MQRHLRKEHDWQSPQRKGRHSVAARLAKTAYSNVVTFPVSCQTFYQQSEFVRFFQVASPNLAAATVGIEQGAEQDAWRTEPSASLHKQVALQLDQKL
jgi:hypothetical protein